MVQREFAQRLIARPGDAMYSEYFNHPILESG